MDSHDHASVTPEALLAYAAGEATPGMAAHIEACAECAPAAAAYTRLDRTLRARLYRSACSNAHTLGELALEMLSPAEALTTRMHLAECPHCAAELAALRSAFLADPLASSVPLPKPPARLVARLLPAPGLQAGFAGLRGNAEGSSLTFGAGPLTLSFSAEPAGDGASGRWMLLGLIVDVTGEATPMHAAARLMEHGAVVAEAALDELGTLVIADLAPGTYDLEIAFADQLVVVSDIPVGAS